MLSLSSFLHPFNRSHRPKPLIFFGPKTLRAEVAQPIKSTPARYSARAVLEFSDPPALPGTVRTQRRSPFLACSSRSVLVDATAKRLTVQSRTRAVLSADEEEEEEERNARPGLKRSKTHMPNERKKKCGCAILL